MLEGKVLLSEFFSSNISPVEMSITKAVSAMLSIANKGLDKRKIKRKIVSLRVCFGILVSISY
jgi:hypothetical protein